MQSNATGSTTRGTAVHDGKMTLDLRQKPTRADLGYPTNENFVAYTRGFDTGGDPIDTTVILPTGTLHIPAQSVSASDGNALDKSQDPDHVRPPLDIQIDRVFPSKQAALSSLAADAPALLVGWHVDIAAAQNAILHGTAFDYGASRLSNWLDVGFSTDSPGTDGTVHVTYQFGIDQWHSPWIDRVVHDGVFTADLTKPPTRLDLAMRDSYNASTYIPYPGTPLSVKLTLPNGVLTRQASSVASASTSPKDTDPHGVNQPTYTTVDLLSNTSESVLADVLADAPLLGLKPADVQAVYDQKADKPSATLTGLSGPVFDVTVKVSFDKTVAATSAYSATAEYTFTYHR